MAKRLRKTEFGQLSPKISLNRTTVRLNFEQKLPQIRPPLEALPILGQPPCDVAVSVLVCSQVLHSSA